MDIFISVFFSCFSYFLKKKNAGNEILSFFICTIMSQFISHFIITINEGLEHKKMKPLFVSSLLVYLKAGVAT